MTEGGAPDDLRASDAERERVVERLRTGAVEGRLTLDELASRAEAAYGATTGAELDRLTRDLPAAPPARRRRTRVVLAAFGGTSKRGRWRPAPRTAAITVFGGSDLDLRHAEIDEPEVTIHLFTLFGGSDVYVPEGVDVDLGGLSLFGGNDDWGPDVAPLPGTPRIRIRAWTLFGGTDVWRIPAGEEPREAMRRLTRSSGASELPPGLQPPTA